MSVLISPTITGPTLLGILLNWGFMGVLAVQIYTYHENFNDRTIVKLLVYGLVLLDVIQTVMVTADGFHWFVYGFGNLAQLDETFLNSWDVPVLDSIIALCAQAFYCWRIYFLRKGLVIPVLILLVSLTQFAAGIVTGVRGHQNGHLSLLNKNTVSETVWLAGAAVADLAIAGVLSWTLLRQRSHALPGNRSIISRIVRLIVETNALTAGVAVIAVILFWTSPATAFVATPVAIIGKLYTNCLLALFNNRMKDTKTNANSHGMVSLQLPPNSTSPENSNSHHGHNSVKVHVTRHTDLKYESESMERGETKRELD
ncbi:hypothetical protein DFH08DRAFT_978312 [Mycena albidolilacea]|uniref:DUF6534 domain-containing protein n=1 Tax=Mycena albidolilacea TaxID=1033008 RepID=A0AAD6YYY7_9AGAR|nr:hypothetical protein DFH08DRAFT_978312 [Mycena albidolilacea]